MEGKRKPTDTGKADRPKKQKVSGTDKSDKSHPSTQTEPLSKHKRKKIKKFHADNKEKQKNVGNDMIENRNISQKSDKSMKASLESKDDVQKKKNRKRKHPKSKSKETSTSEIVNKNLSENVEGHDSVKVHDKGDKRKKKALQSQHESESESKASDKVENEIKSCPVKKEKKRKLKEKIDGQTNTVSEKRRKIGGVEGSNKDNVVKINKTANSNFKFARKEKPGKGHINSEKKERTPLTDRQKHKRWKLKEKKKLKRLSKDSKTDQTEGEIKAESDGSKPKSEDSTETKPKFEKIVLPKGPEDASANWKKLQLVLEAKKSEKETKLPKPHPFRRNFKMERKNEESEKQPSKPSEKNPPDIWFDDVDEIYLEPAARSKPTVPTESETRQEPSSKNEEKKLSVAKNPLVKPDAYKGLTKVVSMDCEMVGVGDGKDNMLARVSIVNQHGEMVYDKFVKPMEDVVDFRTHVSGVRKEDIEKGEDFSKVQEEVAKILKGRLLVGHAIMNDLKVLYLSHPRKRIRDTSRYKPFRQLFQGRTPSLKKLSAQVLSVKVQEGEHNSVQDAQAAMRLYTMYRKHWETEIVRQKKFREKAKDKLLPVVEAASKNSVFQKTRDKSVLDKRKKDKKMTK